MNHLGAAKYSESSTELFDVSFSLQTQRLLSVISLTQHEKNVLLRLILNSSLYIVSESREQSLRLLLIDLLIFCQCVSIRVVITDARD